MQEKSGVKTVAIVLASVLLLVSLIVLAYVYFVDQTVFDGIVLPNIQVNDPEQNIQPEEPDDGFASLDATNVQSVLETLTSGVAYHQVLNLTEYWSQGASTRIVEIYCCNGVTCVAVQAAKRTQYYLTDGETLYSWYQDDAAAVVLPLGHGISLESYLGIPDYMAILKRTQVQEASFLPMDEQNGDRIYVRCTADEHVIYDFWIALESALTERIEFWQDERLVYEVVQQELEILMPGDSLWNDVFKLPDESMPFVY